MKKDKIDQAMMHCYRELFAHSTPPASFDKLLENAKINEHNQKEIPFMDYEIEEERFNDILEDTIKLFKMNDYYAKAFRVSITLGCSPKFKKL